MKTLKLFFGGVLLTFVGLYFAYAGALFHAMVQHQCDVARWESAWCTRLTIQSYASLGAPLPGVVTIVVAIYRFVRWWRTPIVRRWPTAEGSSRGHDGPPARSR